MIDKTARELKRLIEERKIGAAELADQYISEIQQQNDRFHALATFPETGVRLLAESADQALNSGASTGPLHGIPILVDDLIDVANMRTAYGCRAYSEHIPEVDSMAVRRLRAAGALFLGKASTAELGLIISESEDAFVCRSPWSDRHVSGGGSSGACVGVARNFAAAAIALDIGGNVLLPAAFSGVFALVPTYGRIAHTPIYSRGLMFASVALVTRDAADCALLLNVVAGESEVDPLSVRMRKTNYLAAIGRPVRGLSVALVNALWNAPCDDNHRRAIARIEKTLKSADCRVEKERPPIRDSIDAWQTVLSGNLHAAQGDAYGRQPEKLGALAAEWITRGAAISASEYINAQKQIYGLRLLFREWFQRRDALIISAAGCLPFEYGAVPSNLDEAKETVNWQHYASMCSIAAISGFPTAHLPAGMSKDGLPIGVFVIAKPGDEDMLLALCAVLESSGAAKR